MSGQLRSATTVRIDKDCGEALEQFRREQTVIPSKSGAIEEILRLWLAENGYMEATDEESETLDRGGAEPGL
jgi:hypothetical protein